MRLSSGATLETTLAFLMSDATRNKEFAVQTRSHAADGLGIGGAMGNRWRRVLAIAAVGTSIAIPAWDFLSPAL